MIKLRGVKGGRRTARGGGVYCWAYEEGCQVPGWRHARKWTSSADSKQGQPFAWANTFARSFVHRCPQLSKSLDWKGSTVMLGATWSELDTGYKRVGAWHCSQPKKDPITHLFDFFNYLWSERIIGRYILKRWNKPLLTSRSRRWAFLTYFSLENHPKLIIRVAHLGPKRGPPINFNLPSSSTD